MSVLYGSYNGRYSGHQRVSRRQEEIDNCKKEILMGESLHEQFSSPAGTSVVLNNLEEPPSTLRSTCKVNN